MKANKHDKSTSKEIKQFNLKVLFRGLRGTSLRNYKKNLVLSQEQKEILVGTLLGDATILVKKHHYFSLRFEQIYVQKNYIQHLYQIFELFVGTGPKMRMIKSNFHSTDDYGVRYWFQTYAHSVFKDYASLFINRMKKESVKK